MVKLKCKSHILLLLQRSSPLRTSQYWTVLNTNVKSLDSSGNNRITNAIVQSATPAIGPNKKVRRNSSHDQRARKYAWYTTLSKLQKETWVNSDIKSKINGKRHTSNLTKSVYILRLGRHTQSLSFNPVTRRADGAQPGTDS